VHPSGKFVYGSNRGHDTVAAFSVNAKDGTLTYVGNYGAGGKVIRNFGIDPTGKYLFAAHQNSNFIAVFRIDPKTGKLTPTGQTLNAGAPVCVKFARAE
jgi:6-phosphogluconolactonase